MMDGFAYLADIFEQTSELTGLGIKYKQGFDKKTGNPDETLKKIVKKLSAETDTGIIFLAVYNNDGVNLIKQIRDTGITNPILGPAGFCSETFFQQFNTCPKEIRKPGYYTKDIYAASPLIFDSANMAAQEFQKKYRDRYHKNPRWEDAFVYDTAALILQAVEDTGITGQPDTIKADRKKIREYLANLNSNSRIAALGLSPPNYFDENGGAVDKQLFIGIFRNGSIISALGQLRPVQHPELIMNIEDDIKNGYILRIGSDYMYKTNIVYTGVELKAVSEVDDLLNPSCMLDFYIWFRCHDEFDVRNIDFTNAVEPIRLRLDEEPEILITADESGDEKKGEQSVARLVRKERENMLSSVLYHIKARFKKPSALGIPYESGYRVGFKFHNQNLTQDNLVYVTDFIGMGVKDGEMLSGTKKKAVAVDSAEGWTVDHIFFANNTVEKATMGSLKYIENPKKYTEYSQFNFTVTLKNLTSLSLRRKIPDVFAAYLTVFCCAVILFLIKSENKRLKSRPKMVWFFKIILAVVLLLAAESFLTKGLIKDAAVRYRILTVFIFDVLYWLIPALFIHLGMETFIWGPMERRSGRPVPTVLRHLPVYFIYFIAAYGVIVFVFKLDISKLMATSGVLAMGIGLLVKDNIANYFASISIFQSHEIRIGHWVKVGDFEEGKVMEITRMVTRIMKRDGAVLSIPNNVVLNSAIENYSLPDENYLLAFNLETVPVYPPAQVLQVLETGIISVEGVLKNPAPAIVFEGQGDSSAKYTVKFSVKDYERKYHYLTAGWKSVWTHLEKAGIELATPHRVIHLLDETPESKSVAA